MVNAVVRAVIFDLDGTLVDSREAVIDAVAAGVREVTHAYGHGEVDVDPAVLVAALGKPAREYYRAILPGTLVDLADEVKEAATRNEVEALRSGHGRCFDGVLDGFDAMRASGLRLACISNAQGPYFHAALEHLDLRPRLDHVECHDELPADTPAPFKVVMLRRALDALGIRAEEAVMVGDRAEDVESGRELGCGTIGATYGFGDADELAAADHCVDTFAAVPPLVGVERA